MSDLNEPLLPTPTLTQPGDPAGRDVQTRSPHPAIDGNALQQIRSALINAGISVSMLDLPADSDLREVVGHTSETSTLITTPSLEDSDDLEEGNGIMSRVKCKLSSRASRNRKRATLSTHHSIPPGIYSMFFLSKNWSVPFWYSLFTICNKLLLFGIVLERIYRPEGGFRMMQRSEEGHPEPIVQVTQVLLIPVAIGITDEIMITLSLVGSASWAKIDGHPHATRMKYWLSNGLRALDGLTWLLIITSLMLYAVDVLAMFLNFAALQFLQCVDDSAYHMAKEGYLSHDLEMLVKQVEATKLPSIRITWRNYLDNILLGTLFLLMITAWALVNFVDK